MKSKDNATKENAETRVNFENDSLISVNAFMPWGSRKCDSVNLFLVIVVWIASAVMLYFFGLSGPFGRYTIVVQLGIPLYFTYKFIVKKLNNTRN